jgi:AcrR family transcriptional regulator
MARTATAGLSRRRRTAAKSRRDQLLDEAARQLNAKGVSLTSLTDVADMLGVSRAALYYYVDDREDLVFQVYRRSCEIMARHLGEQARSGRSALDIVRAFVRAVLEPDEPEIAALSEIGLLRPAERETVLALYEGVVARLASVLESGAKSGELRPCDFPIVARIIISMIYWIPLGGRWTMAVEGADRGKLVATLCDVIENGVAADRGAPIDPPSIDLTPLEFKTVAAFDRSGLGEARRETILATASRLFNRKGVDTTSLDEIAAELGATKRTLYHYVGDKEALVSACYARAYKIYLYIQKESREVAGSRIVVLTASSRANAIAQQREDLAPLRPMVGFDGLSPAAQAEVEAQSRALTHAGHTFYEEAQREGSMRTLDIDMMMLISPGVTSWLAKGLIAADSARQAEIAREISEVMRVGIRAI